jgi:hypothetical protein
MCIYVRNLAPTTMHFDGTTLDASCFTAFGFRDNMVIDLLVNYVLQVSIII